MPGTEPTVPPVRVAAPTSLPGEAVRKLDAFVALIKQWNRYGRLVSSGDLPRLRERHIADSLTLAPWWRGRLADLGTGAGLPGVPLAIARPEAPVVLVERSERKSRFLRHAISALELANVELVVTDAAAYAPKQPFNTVTARALAPPGVAWRLMRPMLAPGGAGLLQSRAPLADACFEGGRLVESARVGADSWVAVVRADGAP